MPMREAVDWALTVSYEVSLDNAELGEFATCEGLGIEVVIESREEGGNNDFTWSLPTRLKYPNVKLTRPSSADAAKVVRLDQRDRRVQQAQQRQDRARKTSDGKPILTWALADVVPVRWSGPVAELRFIQGRHRDARARPPRLPGDVTMDHDAGWSSATRPKLEQARLDVYEPGEKPGQTGAAGRRSSSSSTRRS